MRETARLLAELSASDAGLTAATQPRPCFRRPRRDTTSFAPAAAALGAGAAPSAPSKQGGWLQNMFNKNKAAAPGAGPAAAPAAASQMDAAAAEERVQQEQEATQEAVLEEEGKQMMQQSLEDAKAVEAKERAKGPKEWLKEANARAELGVRRAQLAAAEAQALNVRLKDQKVSRLLQSVREASHHLLREVPRADADGSSLPSAISKVNRHRMELERAWKAFDAGIASEEQCIGALEKMAGDVSEAQRALDGTVGRASALLRRVWRTADVANRPVAAISKEDMLDIPPAPGAKLSAVMRGEKDPPATAGGCTCMKESECASRGREFNWCVVQDGRPCPIKRDFTSRDAAGADHRIAGSVPQLSWDYCVPPKVALAAQHEDAIPVHPGGQCADRTDVADEYFNNPAYLGKDGQFDFQKVPWKDRLALEVMAKKHSLEQGSLEAADDKATEQGEDNDKPPSDLCMKTPSSGPHKVCPIVCKEGAAGSWCKQRSWDICLTREATTGVTPEQEAEKSKAAEEAADREGDDALIGMSEVQQELAAKADAKQAKAKAAARAAAAKGAPAATKAKAAAAQAEAAKGDENDTWIQKVFKKKGSSPGQGGSGMATKQAAAPWFVALAAQGGPACRPAAREADGRESRSHCFRAFL
eukprot:TRINITY_DN23310_c0_g1_i2.p1 TRINITY_DN23310_c0_g1~~TRINITY_DN23310_c0_g1_i2.p1  ORF type:complete len:646 (-),score=186.96 TRINITY_DN23310_c0_g1_i2:82-2019(-)